MKKLVALLILSAAAQTAIAGPNPNLVRFLLPLYAPQPIPGAHGSLWQSQFAAHNGSAIRPYIIEWCAFEACTADLRADEELVPGETETSLPARYPAPTNAVAGAVIYVLSEPAAGDPPGAAASDKASGVSFQLRIADLSRSAIGAGTEVPVIRENAFRASTAIHLLNVPTDARFRVALRIFEMNLDRADFAVRVVDQATNNVLSASNVSTAAPPQPALRFTPGFAEVNNVTASIASPTVRVEIEPLTAGAAFWAYISITNNESQQVTLVTPSQ